MFRLQDGFSVALHLGCLRKLVLGIDPATLDVVSMPLADGARDDGLGLGSIAMRVHSSLFASVRSAGSNCRSKSCLESAVSRPGRAVLKDFDKNVGLKLNMLEK